MRTFTKDYKLKVLERAHKDPQFAMRLRKAIVCKDPTIKEQLQKANGLGEEKFNKFLETRKGHLWQKEMLRRYDRALDGVFGDGFKG